MRRAAFIALGFVLFSTPALGQTTSKDSQTLQALLAEVRQLRQELRTTSIAMERAQVFIYHLQVQQAAADRAEQRLDDARSKLDAARSRSERLAAEVKRIEDSLSQNENSPQQKEMEETLSQLKTALEKQGNEEQDEQARVTKLEEQAQVEQAKLSELEDQLDRLDRSLANSSAPSGGSQE